MEPESDSWISEQKPVGKMDPEGDSWILPDGGGDGTRIRSVSVDNRLAGKLKSHQKEGVKFIWRNCFLDYAFHAEGSESEIGYEHKLAAGLGISFDQRDGIYLSQRFISSIFYCHLDSGCILPHYMGLGK